MEKGIRQRRVLEINVLDSASINLGYRSAGMLQNHVNSNGKLIRFSTNSVTFHRNLATAFGAVIGRTYRGAVSGMKNFEVFHAETYRFLRLFRGSEKFGIFQGETYKFLRLFHSGRWKSDSFVGSGRVSGSLKNENCLRLYGIR